MVVMLLLALKVAIVYSETETESILRFEQMGLGDDYMLGELVSRKNWTDSIQRELTATVDGDFE